MEAFMAPGIKNVMRIIRSRPTRLCAHHVTGITGRQRLMSAELYDRFASVLKIDQAIFEAEEEMSKVAESMDVEEAFAALDKKYYE